MSVLLYPSSFSGSAGTISPCVHGCDVGRRPICGFGTLPAIRSRDFPQVRPVHLLEERFKVDAHLDCSPVRDVQQVHEGVNHLVPIAALDGIAEFHCFLLNQSDAQRRPIG
jgi:hypothetical protein